MSEFGAMLARRIWRCLPFLSLWLTWSLPHKSLAQPLDSAPVPTWLASHSPTSLAACSHRDKKVEAPKKKHGRQTCCNGCCLDWQAIPGSAAPVPRTGAYGVSPKYPGYFSFQDAFVDHWQDKRPPNGYSPFALMPTPLCDADFRYLETKPNAERTFSESFKRIPISDCVTFSTGGQAWVRLMNEHNSRLTEADNDYTLARTRVFGDLLFGDTARLFGEFLWADSFAEELTPLPIDVNRGDIQNLFVELNLFDFNDQPVYLRGGRQELLLGSQRLVSTLDWANTRRTFDALRLFQRGDQWDFDMFFAEVVPPSASDLDRADSQQQFAGSWLTYHSTPQRSVDFYYLYLDNSNTTRQQDIARAPSEVNTLGTRFQGDQGGWLWDYELMLQFGDQNAQDLFAGAATAGVGRSLKDCQWSPTAWLYYDYASGDTNPEVGDSHTFNQLYPFGHYYLGWIDLVGRQNIHDINAQLFMYPQTWVTCIAQYHRFWLAESRDALYNAGGVAIRRDRTGGAGRDVGDEIDLIANFHLRTNSDLLVGYSRLFGDGFLERTANPNQSIDSELFHLMFQQRW